MILFCYVVLNFGADCEERYSVKVVNEATVNMFWVGGILKVFEMAGILQRNGRRELSRFMTAEWTGLGTETRPDYAVEAIVERADQ